MKKLIIILGGIIIILLGILIFAPSTKAPVTPFPSPTPPPTGGPAPPPMVSSDGHLRVSSPLANDMISSPVMISGTVTGGGWFFEAVFPVKILDGDETVLGRGQAQAGGEPGSWMSTGTVPFTATIAFAQPRSASCTVLFTNDNPSGDPARQKELRIPVLFSPVSAQAACKPTGCSKEICSDEEKITPCIYFPEYACYKTARCERQQSGECGWTQTSELETCIKNATKNSSPPIY